MWMKMCEKSERIFREGLRQSSEFWYRVRLTRVIVMKLARILPDPHARTQVGYQQDSNSADACKKPAIILHDHDAIRIQWAIIVCTSQNISNPKCIGEAEIGQRREPNNFCVRQRRYDRVPKFTDCCCSTQHDEKLNVSLCKSRIYAANVREDHCSTLIVYATVALAGVFFFSSFQFYSTASLEATQNVFIFGENETYFICEKFIVLCDLTGSLSLSLLDNTWLFGGLEVKLLRSSSVVYC